MKSFLAIIPARANSKRLPNKNILPLGEKPLIAWSIEAALQSKYITETVVSTDSEIIKTEAIRYNASVPFLRPQELASDTSTQIDVLKHAIESCSGSKAFDFVVLLQPTSPFRSTEDIDSAIEYLFTNKADAVISVTESMHNPLWCNKLPDNNSLENFLPREIRNTRSQDLPTFFQLNGAIYICNIKKLYEENTLFLSKNIYAYPMPKERSVDIDTQDDFLYAQFLNERRKYE